MASNSTRAIPLEGALGCSLGVVMVIGGFLIRAVVTYGRRRHHAATAKQVAGSTGAGPVNDKNKVLIKPVQIIHLE